MKIKSDEEFKSIMKPLIENKKVQELKKYRQY